MQDAHTPHGPGRFMKQILVVPAAVVVLMTAAVPAGASSFIAPVSIANTGRTTAITTPRANSLGKHAHAFRHLYGLGRKVG
jgi:hypothetical protein